MRPPVVNSRARNHVRNERPRFKLEKQRGIELANAFYTASRSGDMSALGAMLAADVSVHADGGGKRPASPDPIFGFDEVMRLHAYLAKQFQTHQSKLVRTGFINGLPGFVTLEGDGELQTTTLDIEDGRITAIYVVRNPDKLRHHDARLMPAKYVRPYSRGQKNDFRDAEAIAEAVQRPTMKFVATKTAEQVDLQALHRVRERLVSQRTGIINHWRVLHTVHSVREAASHRDGLGPSSLRTIFSFPL
jgi:hypothetical protein